MRICACLVLAFLLGGCCAPHPPAPSVQTTAEFHPTAETAINDKSGVAIMIAYGPYTCLHAAMWVNAPDQKGLFWDPAGGFGLQNPPYIPRGRDLVSQVPTWEEYLAFREEVGTMAVELFTFELPPQKASELHRRLREGALAPGQPDTFDPLTPGMFCSHAVSGFLRQFASERFPLTQAQLYPHKFAAELYRLAPDQVLLCQRQQGEDQLDLSSCKTVVLDTITR